MVVSTDATSAGEMRAISRRHSVARDRNIDSEIKRELECDNQPYATRRINILLRSSSNIARLCLSTLHFDSLF